VENLRPSHAMLYTAEVVAAVGVIVVGKTWIKVMAPRLARHQDREDTR
jgi:hypothetical protein